VHTPFWQSSPRLHKPHDPPQPSGPHFLAPHDGLHAPEEDAPDEDAPEDDAPEDDAPEDDAPEDAPPLLDAVSPPVNTLLSRPAAVSVEATVVPPPPAFDCPQPEVITGTEKSSANSTREGENARPKRSGAALVMVVVMAGSYRDGPCIHSTDW